MDCWHDAPACRTRSTICEDGSCIKNHSAKWWHSWQLMPSLKTNNSHLHSIETASRRKTLFRSGIQSMRALCQSLWLPIIPPVLDLGAVFASSTEPVTSPAITDADHSASCPCSKEMPIEVSYVAHLRFLQWERHFWTTFLCQKAFHKQLHGNLCRRFQALWC